MARVTTRCHIMFAARTSDEVLEVGVVGQSPQKLKQNVKLLYQL